MNKIIFSTLISILLTACNTEVEYNTTSIKNSGYIYQEIKWPYLSESKEVIADNLLEKNYIILLDDSGSMSGQKMKDAKIAVESFISNISDEINISLMTLNMGLIVNFTKDKSLVIQSLKKINTDGGTPLSTSIKKAFSVITKKGKQQLGYGQYGIIIITDGVADSGENPTKIVNKIINETPIEIHTIGFHLDEDHSLNQKGRTFYNTAKNVNQLITAMKGVLAESNEFVDVEF